MPFGKITVPLRVEIEDRTIDTLVEVRHGKGAFELPNVSEASFEVDPLGLLLAFERSVEESNGPLKCE